MYARRVHCCARQRGIGKIFQRAIYRETWNKSKEYCCWIDLLRCSKEVPRQSTPYLHTNSSSSYRAVWWYTWYPFSVRSIIWDVVPSTLFPPSHQKTPFHRSWNPQEHAKYCLTSPYSKRDGWADHGDLLWNTRASPCVCNKKKCLKQSRFWICNNSSASMWQCPVVSLSVVPPTLPG